MTLDEKVLEDVADRMTERLNAIDFGLSFTAERSYADSQIELADQGNLHIDVVPVGHTLVELFTVGHKRYVSEVNIGVRKRFTPDEQNDDTGRIDTEEIDALTQLLERIAAFCVAVELSDDSFGSEEVRPRITYAPNHLRENRQFTGIVTATINTHRHIA